MILLNKSARQKLSFLNLSYKKLIRLVVLSLVSLLLLTTIYFYNNLLQLEAIGKVNNDDSKTTLNDYMVDKINKDHMTDIKDPLMLQLLGYYDTKYIIPTMEKPQLFNEEDTRFFEVNWTKNFKSEKYDYPLKLPSVTYSNKDKLINKEAINHKNCIMLLLSEVPAVKKTIRTIQSIVDNTPNMSKYPFYLITGFYLSDNDLVSIFHHFEDINIEINIIKITNIVLDGKMCGESVEYLFSGISDFKEPEYKEKTKIRFNNDFENNYPLNLYKDTKTNKKWRRTRMNNKNRIPSILEEYGTASIDFNKLQSFDIFQFHCFAEFDNFMTIKPGMIFTTTNQIDLFENMDNDNDDLLVKFTNFRYSQRYRNANNLEVMEKIHQDLGKYTDPIFRNSDIDSVWKQLFSYGMKDTARYNKIRTRIYTAINKMRSKNVEDTDLFNGILLDTQDSIFISKFKLFRSLEYDLFFKNFLIMASINDDSWIPNDPLSLFLGLINRRDGNETTFYRDDFEVISDFDVMFDSTGDYSLDDVIHWNIKSVSEYMKRPNLGFQFDLSSVIKNSSMVPVKRELKREEIEETKTDLEKETNDKEEDKEVQKTFHVDQRFFSKYSYQGAVFFYKNEEFFEFIKNQYINKYEGILNPNEIEELLDLFINDNLIKLKKMFNIDS
ncbi:hypothetical protein ACO0SA_003132 [Hanseniaspora valbyensis]